MKKSILVLITLLVAVLALSACGSNFTGVKDFGGEVSSNGGFAVVKGDYVYFINGKGSSSDDNAFGSVVKGALVRAKLADMKGNGTDVKCEMVVPKLFYTDYDYQTSGFYIFGDYVYYTTPSANKDKSGKVKNSVVEFTRTKLDGTDTKVIYSTEGLGTPYKFVADGDKVYLTVYVSETENDTTANYLVTYSADGKQVTKSQAIDTYVFSADDAAADAYYKKKGHNEERDEDESFDEVYRYSLVGKGEVKVLSGAGMYTSDTGVGTQGVTFGFIKLTKDALYLSEKSVDTSVSSVTRYYGIKLADLTENTAHSAMTLLNKGTPEAASIFLTSSVYADLDKILYNDSSLGLCLYDYNNQDDVKSFGIETLIHSSDLMGYSYCYDDGEYMYYFGNTYYYRLRIEDALAANETLQQITFTTTSTVSDFYKPEVIGNVVMILNTYDPFYNYVCAYDMTTVDNIAAEDGQTQEEAVEAFLTDFATADRAHVLNRLAYRVAILTGSDKEITDKYMENNYPETSAS